jgi:hypothetical protein
MSNLMLCNGHNNTTKGVTAINGVCQNNSPITKQYQTGIYIIVEKCVKIMTTTFG